MDVEHAKKVFPKFFPEGIVPKEAEYKEEDVYRICRCGKIDRDAFISTYEEVFIKKILENKDYDPCEPGTYSTSTYRRRSEAKSIFKCISRKNPPAIAALGKIKPEYGPMQLTRDRIPEKKGTHIDWWIYDQVDPSKEFEKVDLL